MIYDDEREKIIIYVSTYDYAWAINKGKLRSKSSSLYTEHLQAHDKKILLTRTFLVEVLHDIL